MSHRSRISLDGQWEFWMDPDQALLPTTLSSPHSSQITVPSPWQSQSPELLNYSGTAWYQRTLEIPEGWFAGGSIILQIGASDYTTQVWLNQIQVGEHEGGYLPFELDITQAANPGINTLTVRVDDPPSLFPEIPHGKQGWYGPLSGIWQSVWLEHRSDPHIRSLQIYADLKERCVQVQVQLSAPADRFHQVVAQILGPGGELAAFSQAAIPNGGHGANFAMTVPEPMPWSPENPHLYRLQVELENESSAQDSLEKLFGFRTIEARAGKLYLNGELLYLRGALDQDYYPDTIATTPTQEFLEDQFRKAKEMGLNCLRCHIKVADPRYYDIADSMGMLIWAELPNWSTFTESAGQRGRETMQGILERDGHHPSIVIWTIINEDWGTDLVNQKSHRVWLKEMYRWLKAMDPTRLVVDNSPCEPNYHIQTDLEDFHYYRAIPDHRRQWDHFVQDFSARPAWTFCPNGDTVRTGQEPLIVSEFGNWGLPDADLLVDASGKDPWWFETGFEWSEGIVYPQGVRTRFNNLGLARVFGSWKAFIEATQWQQFAALKYQIEAMRRQPDIRGYVITELTDVHWECNGLLDMRRNPKAFYSLLKNINANTVVIPEWERVAYWSGEPVEIGVSVSHGGGQDLEPGEIRWRLSSGHTAGSIPVDTISAGKVKQAGQIQFSAPDVLFPIVQRLVIDLFSSHGELLATNSLDLSFYPRRASSPAQLPALGWVPRLYTSDAGLAERLSALGYSMTGEIAQADAVITGRVDPEMLAFLSAGGRLLLLADRSEEQGVILPGVKMYAREGTQWCGDWASSFSWLNRQGPFAAIPGQPLIDHSFDRIIPEHVLVGFRDWDYRCLVHAGMVVGWVHKPAALIGERFYGKGKAVLNTFHLPDDVLGSDPTATVLMDGLIELLFC